MATVIADHSAYVQSAEKMIVAVEDEWNIWPLIRSGFESRLPIRSALLTNKNRQTVEVRGLSVDFVLTTDPKLVNRPAVKNSPHWFRHPYATIILVSCEDAEEYRLNVRPKLQLLVRGEWREWLIIHVIKISSNDTVNRAVKKISSRIEDHFRKDRVCRLELDGSDNATWQEIETKIVECIRLTLETRIVHYNDEVNRIGRTQIFQTSRSNPNSNSNPANSNPPNPNSHFNFSAFFIDKAGHFDSTCQPSPPISFFLLKESLAFMFEMAQLREEALNEYEELEKVFLEIIKSPHSKLKEFGGKDEGDEKSFILDYKRKPFSSFSQPENLKQFDFHQYLFARQAQLLLSLDKIVDLAQKGYKFIQYFSKELQKREKELSFCFQEIWVFTSCLSLAKLCGDKYISSSINNHFYSIIGDLYAYARTKLMRIMTFIGYGKFISNSPCNSSSLDLGAWPDMLMWPSFPSISEERVKKKEPAVKELLENFPNKERKNTNKFSMFPSHHFDFINQSRSDTNVQDSSDLASSSTDADSATKILKALSEMYASAEISLDKNVMCTELEAALSSSVLMEELYEDVTRAAAGNYLRSMWRRHGAALDAELAHSYILRGDYRGAIHQYEKLCAVYLAERWHSLAAYTLRHLLRCQIALSDVAAMQSTRIRLLSLDKCHVAPSERVKIQHDLLELARKNNSDAILLDISSLLSFSVVNNEVTEMGEGDSDIIKVFIWSNFPEVIEFDLLTLTLVAAPHFNAEEGIKVQTSESIIIHPQQNQISFTVKAMRSGVYVLSSLICHVLQLHLRSTHVSVKAKSPEEEEYLSFERLLKPALKVSPPRHLVDASAVVNKGLLVNTHQWIGLKINPINYSIQNACIHISNSPVINIPSPQLIEIEIMSSDDQSQSKSNQNLHRLSSLPLSSSRNSSTSSSPITSPYLSPKSTNPPIPDQSPSSPFSLQIDSFLLPSPLSPAFQDISFSPLPLPLLPSLPSTFIVSLKDGKFDLPDVVKDKTCIVWLRVLVTKAKEEASVVPFPSSPRSPFLHSPSKSLSPSPSYPSPFSSKGDVKVKTKLNSTAQDERNSSSIYGSPIMNPNDSGEKMHNEEKNVDCFCTLHLKMEFGPSRSRLYEKAISLHFTEAFLVMTRVISRSIDGELLLQITFKSQISSNLQILKAKLQLQDGLDFVSEKKKKKKLIEKDNVKHKKDDKNDVQSYQNDDNDDDDNDDDGDDNDDDDDGDDDGDDGDGDLSSWILPLTLSPKSEFSLLYNFIPSKANSESLLTPLKSKISNSNVSEFSKQSTIMVDYIIHGDRMTCAHSPAQPISKQFGKNLTLDILNSNTQDSNDQDLDKKIVSESPNPIITCTFSHSFVLQLPLTQRKLAVGILPMPDMAPKVGHVINLTWQIERLEDGILERILSADLNKDSDMVNADLVDDFIKDGDDNNDDACDQAGEIFYEVKVLPEQWMIAGRKKGFFKLPLKKGSCLLVQLACIPVSSGFLNPPILTLPMVERCHISNMPAGPRLICVLPSDPCYRFCATKFV